MTQQTVTLLSMLLPPVILIAGLMLAVSHDTYISRRNRSTLLFICTLVYALIAQNALECYLTVVATDLPLRTIVSIVGYTVRPAILALFCRIVAPARRMRPIWCLVIADGLLYLTALVSPVTFFFDADNRYHGGPLSNTCLYVSIVLLLYLFYLSCRAFQKTGGGSRLIPALTVLLIIGSVLMDDNVGYSLQPVTFLTLAIVISSVFYYIWLHMQFVYSHEQELMAGQRMQLMLSQIKPHFLYNALTAIEDLCELDPPSARAATSTFARYLRGNMSALSGETLIPFERELEHTKRYLELEQLRFEDDLTVRYHITCTDFLLPPLTLEPLAENAVRHGVRGNEDGRGTVIITTREYPNRWEISVMDDGPGFDPEQVPEDGEMHIGLTATRSRVERLCGGSLHIESAPGRGTTAAIVLPKEEVN